MSQMIDEIFSRCPEMFAVAQKRSKERWFAFNSHTHERHKFSLFPNIDILDKFRNYYLGGIGENPHDLLHERKNFSLFENIKRSQISPGNTRVNIIHAIKLAKKVLRSLEPVVSPNGYSKGFYEIFSENIVDVPDYGGLFASVKLHQRDILMSLYSARTAHRGAVASELYRRETESSPNVILELGGGFGKTLADLMRIFPSATAFYVDLPMNMAVAAHYLHGRFPNRVNLIWCETDAIEKGKINVVAPWLIDKIDIEVDLMVNFLSMHHMPQQTIDYYFATLIAPRVRYFYHENRLVPRMDDEGEGYLLHSHLRKKMDISHSVRIPWRAPNPIFSEFIRNIDRGYFQRK